MKKTINCVKGIILGTAMAVTSVVPVFAAAAVGNTPISIEVKRDTPEVPKYSVTVPTSLALVVYADSTKGTEKPGVYVGGVGAENGTMGSADLMFENESTLTTSNAGKTTVSGMELKISDALVKTTGTAWSVVTNNAAAKQLVMTLDKQVGVQYGKDVEFANAIALAAPVVKDPATGALHAASKTPVAYGVTVGGTNADYAAAEAPAAAFTVEWTIDRK